MPPVTMRVALFFVIGLSVDGLIRLLRMEDERCRDEGI
jgi:hypothetical protein